LLIVLLGRGLLAVTRTPNQSLRILTGVEAGRFRPGPAAVRRTALLVVLTVAVALVLVRVTDLAQIRDGASRLISQPELLAVFLVSYTVAFWLRAVAWRQLFSPAPGTLPLFGILQVALFANHVLPLKAGEVVRPYLLTRHGVGATTATTTTVVARLLDFLVLLLLATMLLLTAGNVWSVLRILALPIVILGGAAAVLLWLRTSSLNWGTRAVPVRAHGRAPLPIGASPRYPGADAARAVPQSPPDGGSAPGSHVAALPDRLGRVIRAAGDGLRAIAPSRVARAALWTLPSWILEGAVVIIAARTIGIGLSVPVAVAVTAVTILFQIVHLTPGGLGVYEASMAGALALHGLPLEQGVTLAVIAHGMKFVYALVIGGVCAALAARAVVRSRAGRDQSRPYEVAAVGARLIAPTVENPVTPPERVARP